MCPPHLTDHLTRFAGSNMGNGASIEYVQVGQFSRPYQTMPGAGKTPGHFFNFAYI
jgi:hypothetical protein